MKNIKALPMAGLMASSVLFISYLILLVLFITNPQDTLFAVIIRGLKPLFIICILLGLRYILITISKLNHFKIVIVLMIILQVLVFLAIWALNLNLLTGTFAIPITILGLVQVAFYIWFFVLIFMVENIQVKAISILRYFTIAFMLFFLAGVVLKAINEDKFEYAIQLLKFITGLPLILLALFFYKNQKLETESAQ